MAYRIKKLANNPRRTFKVQYCTYELAGRKDRDIPESEWAALGFRRDMSLEEAHACKDSLNALEHVRATAEKRQKIKARLEEEDQVTGAFLSPYLVQEFEQEILYGRTNRDAIQRNKTESHWRAARRVLCALKIEPSDWANEKGRFYDYFSELQLSPAYLQKVFRILNQWGSFQARRNKTYFAPLPFPTGYEKQRVADAYFEKNEDGLTSDPMSPLMLEAARSALKPQHYNWLAMTVWFGLRPIEVDGLRDPKKWRLENHGGTQVLFIYQSKLMAVAREKRWKPIPAFLPQQVEALKLMGQDMKRPTPKTMANHFGERVTLYAGRKGFTDLMLNNRQSLENISTWMGHTTIERTWKSYKNRQTISFNPLT